MFEYIDEIRQEIITAFTPHWALNDEAHRQAHFEEVFQTGLVIKEKARVHTAGVVEILFAAYFHDLFAWSRINHHEMAYDWMMATDHPLIERHLNTRSRESVAIACLHHRASFRGNFTTRLGELINSADRGMPGDVQAMLRRAIQYRVKNNPEQSDDERMESSIRHLKEKYGTGGYARYPDLYKEVFGEQLNEQRNEIDKMFNYLT